MSATIIYSLRKQTSLMITVLFFSLIALTLISNSNENKNEKGSKKNKRYNPYKTKEKIEQEEEFDEPELLGSKVPQEELDLETSEIPNKSDSKEEEEEKSSKETTSNDQESTVKPNTNNNFQEKTYQHSDELELEASKGKLFLKIFTIYEVLMMVMVVAFILTCFSGKSTNEALANKWFSNNREFFINNYAHIGTETQYNIDTPMLKESYNNFKFYASGRVNINYTLVSLDLMKRQDLLSQLGSLFFPSEKDRLIIEFSVNCDLQNVFCICRKKDIKYMKKTYPDIDYMTKNYEPEFMSTQQAKNLVLLTEDDESIDLLFDRNLKNSFEKVQGTIDIIYFTDRQTYSKEKYVLFCSFYVDSMKNAKAITEFCHLLVDKISNIELGTKRKANSEKLRKEYEEFLEREKQKKTKNTDEENEKKVSEEKRKKEVASKKVLTRDQMIKQEEKERKEKYKKQRQKLIKIMK